MTTTEFRGRIEDMRQRLNVPQSDYGYTATMILGWPEIQTIPHLLDLAWSLHQSAYVHRNDIIGLVDLLEEYLEKQEKKNNDDIDPDYSERNEGHPGHPSEYGDN